MHKFYSLLCILFVTNACKNRTNTPIEVTSLEVQKVNAFENPSSKNSKLPRLFSNGETLYFSWVAKKDSLDVLNYSTWQPHTWSEISEVVSGNDWFTNWADFPSIAENNGNILTSFLQKSATGTYTYDVKLNLYNAKTKTWIKNFILHNDGTESEHGFVTIRPYAGDSFLVTWLDGRETVGKGHGGGQMTLRAAIVFEDGRIDYDTLLDEKVCDCCQTTAAIGPNDEIIVGYRDRTDDEIRDISIVRWDKERQWTAPKAMGNDEWRIAGCPVNGPSMDAFNKSVALAWFTGVGEEGKVQVVFSKDTGISFGNVTRLDAGNATGRVDLTLISETEAIVIWMEPRGEEELIQLIKISEDGLKSNPITVARTTAERAGGFPQLEKIGDNLVVAWTVVGALNSEIKMATIRLEDI